MAGLLVAGIGVVVGLFLARDTGEPVSLEDARARFRREQDAGPDDGSAGPPDGVYSYRGSGSDRLSFPPLRQEHGPGIPGTVTHQGGDCWTFRMDYSSHHWQTWDYCSRAGRLDEHGGRTFQRWDLGVTSVENVSSFTCDPPAPLMQPGMQVGDAWRQSCGGTNTSVSGTTQSRGRMRFVGVTTVRVGDERVPAVHLRQRRTLTGAQTGSERIDLWLRPDGLPLRNDRLIIVRSDSPVGKITYTERGRFVLASRARTGG